jgi:hypothetical protein
VSEKWGTCHIDIAVLEAAKEMFDSKDIDEAVQLILQRIEEQKTISAPD